MNENMETGFRHHIMKTAHEINRATQCGKAAGLIKAWQLYHFEKSLRSGIVWFTFRKKDGSIRLAKGTLKDTGEKVKEVKKRTYKTVSYYDLTAGDFRCFKVENLIAVY